MLHECTCLIVADSIMLRDTVSCFQLTLKEITLRSEKSNGPKLLSEFHRHYRVEGQRDLIFSIVLGSFALLVFCPIILTLLKNVGPTYCLARAQRTLTPFKPLSPTAKYSIGNHVV